MKILLLGGNGYLGSVLYPKLQQAGYNTHSVDLCLFGKNQGYSSIKNYNSVDISNYDTIICLAGHSSVQMCNYSPSNSWINNVEYFRNLSDNLRFNQKLIYASSASVYGNTDVVSTETTPINFSVVNNYDLQKITIDLIANKRISDGLNIVGLRFGTINGISPNTRHELMLNSMVKSAQSTGVVNIKNRRMSRSILGINDAVEAILSLVKTKVQPGYYNLSSFSSTVGEMAKYVSNSLDASVVDHGEDKVFYNFELDTTKIQKAIGYTPKDTISTLVDGLVKNYSNVHCENRDTDKDFYTYL